MSEEMTIAQYMVKLNETIPNLKKCRYYDIEIGLVPEATDAYWHFLVGDIKLYKDSERNNCVKTISGDTIEYYTKTMIGVKIFKKDKHLENVYIDKTKDSATYIIRVDNLERTYNNVVFRKWDFGKNK